jgi:nicotinamide riboside kinase
MTKIINFYGGPGTGKSTTAALMYAKLKLTGVNAELVREYVKDWAWEGRKINTYDQLYLLGKQIRRESLLYGKTDVIVTDSPVMLGVYYAEKYSPQFVTEGVTAGAKALYRQAEEDGYKHTHVMLTRTKPYSAKGRYQTEAEAKLIDSGVEEMLRRLDVPYITTNTDEASIEKLIADLKLV